MARSADRIRACELRREGKSVKEIARLLDASRGSVSAWTRDIVLAEPQRQALHARQIAAGHAGRIAGTETNKRLRRERLEHAKAVAESDIPTLSDTELFFIGLGLYWGEGTKSDKSALSVANSDPRAILLMKRWFMVCLGVEETRFMPRIFISDTYRDREEIILGFWSKILDIPAGQFKRTAFLDKGKKIYENHDVYYGVLALGVSKGGEVRNRILAQIARVAELNQAGVVQELERGTHKP